MSRNEMMTAEVLDRAIDEILAGTFAPGDSGPASEASRLAAAFAALPPSTGRTDVRRRVLSTALATRRGRRFARRLVVVSATVSLLGGGIAVAARNATPGNPLFKVRRGISAVRVAVALGDKAKAVALLDRAAGDVADAKRLADAGDAAGAVAALDVFRRDIRTARAEIARLAPKERSPLFKRAAKLQAEAANVRSIIARLHKDRPDGKPAPSGSAVPGDSSGKDVPTDEESDGPKVKDPSEKQKDPSEKPKDPSQKQKDPSDKQKDETDPSSDQDPSTVKVKDKQQRRDKEKKPDAEDPAPSGGTGAEAGDDNGRGKKKDPPAE